MGWSGIGVLVAGFNWIGDVKGGGELCPLIFISHFETSKLENLPEWEQGFPYANVWF